MTQGGDRPIADILNGAARQAIREDQEDLAVVESRSTEPVITYETLLEDLKANGKLSV